MFLFKPEDAGLLRKLSFSRKLRICNILQCPWSAFLTLDAIVYRLCSKLVCLLVQPSVLSKLKMIAYYIKCHIAVNYGFVMFYSAGPWAEFLTLHLSMLLHFEQKLSNLILKTYPGQLLGSFPLAIVLSV